MTQATSTVVGRRQLMAAFGAAVLGNLSLNNAFAVQTRGPLRLAVVPQLTPVEMTRAWSPIVEALGRRGIACELVVYPSIANFEPEFMMGKADLLFLNPYHMVMAKKAHGYEPILRDTRPLEGVLVVKRDGPVKALDQLKDLRISFPAPNAFAASLYMRSVLERQYHLLYETHYAQNHRNAIRQVLVGDSAAAGVVKTTLEKEPQEVQESLRILYTTPGLSPHPLAVHPRIPARQRAEIVAVFMEMAANPQMQSQLAAIQMPKPQTANYARDYAPLERLKIEKYVVVD